MQKPSAFVHRQILQLTLPSVATNLTVPLLGIADTTIVGHMGRAEYIAAIAVCTTLFNMIYWVFAFLRMGTTGLVAQAWGKGETTRAHTILSQALVLGNTLGVLIVLAQTLIFEGACHFMHLTEHLKSNRHDFGTQRAMLRMIGKRRQLLEYLKAVDIERYRAIVKKLNLRK